MSHARGIGIPAHVRANNSGRFPCSRCQHARSHCYDSRPNATGIRRMRCCAQCGHRWTTYETIAGGPSPIETGRELAALRARLTEAAALIDKLSGAAPDDTGGEIIDMRRLREIG